jgi:diguanylate cyclase (GGDEF)-like protein
MENTIEAWLVKDVITVDPDQNVFEAAVLMSRNNIGSILIIDKDKKPLGIFTERDLMNKVIVTGKDCSNTKIREVMTSEMKTAGVKSSYKEVYDMMRTNNIRHLPIVDEGILVGIVSIKDLLRFNMRSNEKILIDMNKEMAFLKKLLDESNDSRNKELYEENKKLQGMIIVDSLTGLYNFSYFQEILAKEISRAQRYQRPVTLLFIDIDHFKHYNDLNGHEAGNLVLQQLASILRNTTRVMDGLFKISDLDIVARYGGEEFVIILPETGVTGGFSRAKRILEEVRAYPFYNREKQPEGTLTVSIGIAEYPSDADLASELIKKADAALYKAKNSGRDKISGP